MRRRGSLRGRGKDLVKDLKGTTLSFQKLGKKYGVSRQGIHIFCKRRGIKRPERLNGHKIEECRLCQKLVQISRKSHSELISIHTIMKITGESRAKNYEHLRILKTMGLVRQRFGKLRSKRVEKAYAIYLTKKLPISTIERKAGLTNFHSVIKIHRNWGYDVPPSLYVYDTQERSRVSRKIKRGKHQDSETKKIA